MLKEKFLTLWSSNRLAFILASLGLVFILIGIFTMIFKNNSSDTSRGVLLEEAASDSGTASSSAMLVVDVSGAVVNPGVYKLAVNARIQDALIASGGLASDANREYIAKNINLAAKLTDGAKIYIPSESENTNLKSQNPSGGIAGNVTGIININSASQGDLESLPGIGPVTAQKIIDNRSYSKFEELLEKKIVGQKVFDQIKDKISIY